MNTRTIGILGLCIALAGCNSEPAEEAAPTEVPAAETPSTTMTASVVMEPAPEGLPSRIAREVIAESGQTCTEVANAERGANGTITANCAGGETYQIYTQPGQGPVAVEQ